MSWENKSSPKGFTLIELLVVVTVIAILSVVVILTINPSEILKQSRDSRRLNDLEVLKKAISLYLADAGSSPNLGTTNKCYASSPSTPGSSGCGGRMSAATVSTTTVASSTTVDGGGWIPINFRSMSFNTPIGTEPVDPVNDATYFYSYATNSSYQFEIDANFESARYSASGTSDIESKDGGNKSDVYETGSNLTL